MSEEKSFAEIMDEVINEAEYLPDEMKPVIKVALISALIM